MSDVGNDGAGRMSDLEALMWELERSPLLSNTFSNLTMLDRPPVRSELVSRMANATRVVPRLHQRPVATAGRLDAPVWTDDPDFDLDHHLRWVSLGSGATDRDLYDFVAALGTQPFDRERPLWDFTVVEGLTGGRAALVQRMHHTVTDGEGGIRLSMAFVDLERDAPGRAGGEATDAVEGRSNTAERAGGGDDAAPPPSPGEATDDSGPPPAPGTGIVDAARSVTGSVLRRGGQLVDLMGSAGSFVLHPGDSAELARSAGRQVLTLRRSSPLWTERTTSRWFDTLELDLDEVKDAAHRLGGSVNDFFVTGAVAAAGRHHREHGAPVEELRVSMPMSLRHDLPRDQRPDPMAGGNAFTMGQAMVPTGEMGPGTRFGEVHARLATTRGERVLSAFEGAAAVMGLLPTTLLLATGERATAGIDFVCSNVRAAPFDLYMAGALMEANYPAGPLAGTAFNLTTMSYRGRLCMGLHVDAGAVTDPESLRTALVAAYAELFEAARAAG